MRGLRAWHTFRLYTIMSATKRTKYLQKNNIFYHIGDNCLIMDRKVPLYARLISLGNNVKLASNVHFVTHDITHLMINAIEPNLHMAKIQEQIGCISIGDNVFVGTNTTILLNTRIGSNVIIGANTVVNKDIPDNSVVVGIPARVVGTFDDFLKKRMGDSIYPANLRPSGEFCNDELVTLCWNIFYKLRN